MLNHNRSIVEQLNISGISLGKLPPLPIVDEIHQKVRQIENGLIECGIERFRSMLSGSLVCGHYTQPKPASHSLNPDCPYERVIECDMRVVLPKEIDILRPGNIKMLEEIVGAKTQFTQAKTIMRFGDEIPMVVLYDYKEIADCLGLEFEICINSEPYFEIATVWNEVFTPEEIQRQTDIREIARNVLQLDYHSEFQPLKQIQAAECRYRICANYWMLVNMPEMIGNPVTDYKPLSARIQPYLMPKIHTWFEVADRPYSHPYPQEIVEKFKSVGMGHLLNGQPKIPRWLEFLEGIKEGTKNQTF